MSMYIYVCEGRIEGEDVRERSLSKWVSRVNENFRKKGLARN